MGARHAAVVAFVANLGGGCDGCESDSAVTLRVEDAWRASSAHEYIFVFTTSHYTYYALSTSLSLALQVRWVRCRRRSHTAWRARRCLLQR